MALYFRFSCCQAFRGVNGFFCYTVQSIPPVAAEPTKVQVHHVVSAATRKPLVWKSLLCCSTVTIEVLWIRRTSQVLDSTFSSLNMTMHVNPNGLHAIVSAHSSIYVPELMCHASNISVRCLFRCSLFSGRKSTDIDCTGGAQVLEYSTPLAATYALACKHAMIIKVMTSTQQHSCSKRPSRSFNI